MKKLSLFTFVALQMAIFAFAGPAVAGPGSGTLVPTDAGTGDTRGGHVENSDNWDIATGTASVNASGDLAVAWTGLLTGGSTNSENFQAALLCSDANAGQTPNASPKPVVGDGDGSFAIADFVPDGTIGSCTDPEVLVMIKVGANWQWVAAAPLVSQTCGNNIVEGTEDCDDNNTDDGDCCSSTCAYEGGGSNCGDDGSECVVQDTCDGAGSCTDNGFVANDTDCGDTGTECINQDKCNGSGTCADNGFVANDTDCGDTGTECINQDKCNGSGTCTDNGFVANDTDCGDTGTECINQDKCNGSGTCTDNGFVANDTDCGDTGTECINQDKCNGSGSCTDNGFVANDTDCGDTGTECVNQDKCNGSGSCTDNGFVANDTDCGDAGTECTNQDKCNGSGSCTDNGFVAGDTDCGDTGTECINQDKCDGAGSCTDNGFVANDTDCGDTGTECINQDKCNGSGSCTDNGFVANDTNCGDTGTDCTNQDKCDGSGSCTDNGFVADDTDCGGDPAECDAQDTCDGAGTCDDNGFADNGDACGADPGECEAQDTCDGAGTCDDNGVANEGDPCGDDGSDCMVQDTCDDAGSCEDNGLANEGDPCGDDGTDCIVQDTCDGGGACQDNGFVGNGDPCGVDPEECDVQDTCDGAGTCDDNGFVGNGEDCGDDDTECIVQDTCDGAGTCDDNGFVSDGEPCGDDSETECTDADTCDGAGLCLFNNVPCGSFNSRGNCEFDEEPDKGTCDDTFEGELDGEPCSLGSGDEDCELTPDDGGTCVPSDQFRLAFSPHVENWVSYKLNASGPGQFSYNAIFEPDGPGDVLYLYIPYPFVTQGATPLHLYDAALVDSNGEGCLAPEGSLANGKTVIGLEDWIQDGVYETPDYLLGCDQVDDGVVAGDDGWCAIAFEVTEEMLAAMTGDLLLANLHLDYGLKGPFVDADNDGEADYHDRAGYVSPWGTSDALKDTDTNDGDLSIADCNEYLIGHESDEDGGIDSLESVNAFKKIAGAFGRIFCGDDGTGMAGTVELQTADGTTVFTSTLDDEGFYALAYRHRGKAAEFQIKWTDGGDSHTTETFFLQSNGWVNVDVEAVGGCDDLDGDTASSDWTAISPLYGKGKFKNTP